MPKGGREWSPRGPKGILLPWKTGDIIIPGEATYPEGALEVLEILGEGEFRATPPGGGPVYRFGPTQIEKYRFRKVSRKEMEPVWRRGRFSMDALGELVVDGWTTGELWNGWATPVFEKKAAEAVLKETAEMYKEIKEKFKWAYSAKTDTFSYKSEHDEETQKDKGYVIGTPEGPKDVYAIGTGCWCWEETEQE